MQNKKTCTKCSVEKSLDCFYKHKGGRFGVYSVCKYCVKEYKRNHYKKNRKDKLDRNRQYREENRGHLREKWRGYREEKYCSNPLFRLAVNCRDSARRAFRYQGYTKRSKTHEILGCSYERLKQHLESQFKPGMTWDNYGDWHIDHIVPLASATTEEEVLKLCHYTNLQPLWAEENLSKGAKVA